jgi:hypothetical protein
MPGGGRQRRQVRHHLGVGQAVCHRRRGIEAPADADGARGLRGGSADHGQRRADALGALAAGADRLACSCADPHCPSGGDDGRAANVVVHVVTEAAALNAQPDPHMSGTGPPDTDADAPQGRGKPPAGLLLRGGIVPTPLLAELIRSGAKVNEVRHPGDAPEPGYRPSAALEEFVRVRDLPVPVPKTSPSQHMRNRPPTFWMIEVRIFSEPASDRCVYVIVE